MTTETQGQPVPVTAALPGWRRILAVVAAGVACLAVGASLGDRPWANIALAAGTTTLFLGAGIGLVRAWRRLFQRRAADAIGAFVVHDAAMCLIADDTGEVLFANASAKAALAEEGATVAARLATLVADPRALVLRLQNQALRRGHASEDLLVGPDYWRLSVTRIGEDCFLWRADQFSAARGLGGMADTAHLPVISVGRNGTILFMSQPARELAGSRVRRLEDLVVSMPLEPGEVNAVRTPSGPVDCLVAELSAVQGRTEYCLLPLGRRCGAGAADPVSFDALPVPLMKLAHDGTVLRLNAEAARLLGRTDAEGRPLGELMEGLGRSIADWLDEALSGRAPHDSEFLRISGSHRETFVQVTLKRMTDDDGVPALVAVLNDATELKTLEAQFVQSQKMQAIGQLAGGIAHDFNNLLTAISGHCDLLMLRRDQSDPDFADLFQIHQNVNRASALVSQLLAFSRKQRLRPEILDLHAAMADLAHLLNRLVGERVELDLDLAPRELTVRVDRRQLEQVVMNLVVNARDAMPGGGRIGIRARRIRHSRPVERDRARIPAGEYVEIAVTDQGTGIPPDKIAKIFEPFYTTKRTGEGTGLGLSTAYGIVKQSGGYIFVDSEPGVGSTFTLLFPYHPAPQAEVAPPDVAPHPPQARAGSILLVEDEAPVRAFASRALSMQGYAVHEAASGEEALALLANGTLDVDLFVTDVVMPGLDGPGWVREARKKRPEVGVVFVSGYAEDSVAGRRDEIPNAVFLPKPYSLTQLTEIVERQLARAGRVEPA